ncbi:unnamed protein product, partial [marine sediment metagenome]
QGVAICLEVDNGSDLTISNNVLCSCDAHGILSPGSTTDNASSVTIEDNVIYGSCVGIAFDAVAGGSELNIYRNTVFDNMMGIGIEDVVEESTVAIEENFIADNYYGIDFFEVDDSTVTIAGNTIGEGYCDRWDFHYDANGYGGIYFSDVYNGSTVTIGGATRAEGNIIVGNGWEGDSDGGIYVNDLEASSLEILNNDILDNYEDGIYIGDVLDDSSVVILNNDFKDNTKRDIYISDVHDGGSVDIHY